MTDEHARLRHRLAIARQRVADGAERVARQRGLVARLIARGHRDGEPLELLTQMLVAQRHFEEHCARLERQLAALDNERPGPRRHLSIVAK
jgi:hypothetical protein